MALKSQPITITYVAWNSFTGAPQSGDVANHTLRLIQDGTEGAPTNAPGADDAARPGVYTLALTAADMDFNAVTVCGVSSTAHVTILPVQVVTERGVLPAAAPAATGGLPIVGSAPLTNLDAAISTLATSSALASLATTVGAAGAGLTSIPYTGPAVSTIQAGLATATAVAALPTAAEVATAILTDTTAGDLATAGSPGAWLKQLGGTFTTTTSSIFAATALANTPTGGGGGVTVAGYATGQDPATLLLVTPANKIATGTGGIVSANVAQWLGTAPATPVIAGVPIVDKHYADGLPDTAACQGGSTTTVVLAASESTTVNYASKYVAFSSGACESQARLIVSSSVSGSTVTATIDRPWDGGASPAAGDLYWIGGYAITRLDLTQPIPAANAAQTTGDALNAARAQGFGAWALSGTTLTLYAGDGTTIVRSFTLDSATAPTSRS
jgi:hypothetical protein